MSELRDLYQDLILEHARSPRNFRVLLGGNVRAAEGYNPLCGDHFTIYAIVEDGVIRDAAFQGAGCAISTASASVMTETLKGRTEDEAGALYESFHELVTGRRPTADAALPPKLAVFTGVSEYPARVKCASLAWHSMASALQDRREIVTTE